MVSNSNKKIKILYVITKSNWGGAGRYVYDLATNLPKDKFDVAVALGGEGRLKTKLEETGVRTIPISYLKRDVNILEDISVFFNLLKIFKVERPDIVHLNSSKIGGMGALAGRIAQVKKIIFTAHGWAWGEDRNIIQKNIIKFLSWITILLSHKTITVSKYDEKLASSLLFVTKKLTTIHNGIPEINFTDKITAREILLNKQNIHTDDETLWVGAIGELHKNKGFYYAIEAFSILSKTTKNFVFIIIGDGEERRALQNLIERHQLEKNILIFKREENGAELLKAFDVFLLSSIKEGLPYVVLEAGMAKIPTIATSTGGISEIIRDLKSGILIQPKNPEAILKSISYISTNKDKSRQFGEKLHTDIINKFSTTQMVNNTTKIY